MNQNIRTWPTHDHSATEEDTTSNPFARTNDFEEYLRPKLGRMLNSLRLDVSYDRARGDRMEYEDDAGRRRHVFDFLGGYGALLFGHNHPELTRAAIDVLQQERPFGAQASVRATAARLGRKLSEMFADRWGSAYTTTLANSGAEAVEIALKHACMAHDNRKRDIIDRIEHSILKMRNRYHPEHLSASKATQRQLAQLLPGRACATYAEVIAAIRELNDQALHSAAVYCCLEKSYHGKTTGALQLTAKLSYREPFISNGGPRVLFVDRSNPADFADRIATEKLRFYSLKSVSTNDAAAPDGSEVHRELELETVELTNIAALFVEPIQGEGGVHVIASDFLRQIRSLCSEAGVHLVFDEIQSGMGRTGAFLAAEHSGVQPDYILLSKSLGGGITKISSASVRADLYEEEFGVLHTSTFTEDDLSSAVALRALELLEEQPDIMRSCAEKGEAIRSELLRIQNEYPEIIKEVRGEGLMLAIEFHCQEKSEAPGFRALAASDLLGFIFMGYLVHEHQIHVAPLLSTYLVLRLEPPACIEEEAMEKLYAGVERLCRILRNLNFYELTRYIVGRNPEPGTPREAVQDYRNRYYTTPDVADAERTVAFVMHFVNIDDTLNFDFSCKDNYTREDMQLLLDKTYMFLKPFPVAPKIVYSKLGKKVRLQPYAIAITSAMVQQHMEARERQTLVDFVEQAIEHVDENGIKIMGFGNFTSIIMQNCKAVRNENIAVTTGNSLTVGMGYEALLYAAGESQIDLETACFAAIGANGNIGTVYCELMVEHVPEIILIGRPGREDALENIAINLLSTTFFDEILSKPDGASTHMLARRIRETPTVAALLSDPTICTPEVDRREAGRRIYEGLLAECAEAGTRPPVWISTDPADVRHANLILGASSQSGSLIQAENLRPDKIVICDVALPADTDESVFRLRPDVTVLLGGEVRVPPVPADVALLNANTSARDFLVEGVPIRPDHMFACMCETTLLGLTGITSNYSYGEVSKNRVREILDISRMHGFSLGALKTKGTL